MSDDTFLTVWVSSEILLTDSAISVTLAVTSSQLILPVLTVGCKLNDVVLGLLYNSFNAYILPRKKFIDAYAKNFTELHIDVTIREALTEKFPSQYRLHKYQ